MHELDGLGYHDKTIVVTGGSSRMGEATAKILGRLGAKVHIVDIQEPRIDCASFHKCDLSEFDQGFASVVFTGAISPAFMGG